MRKPPRFWEKTFASLGFVRRREGAKFGQRKSRAMRFESLEPRQLLSATVHVPLGLRQFLSRPMALASTDQSTNVSSSLSASGSGVQSAATIGTSSGLRAMASGVQPMVPITTLYWDPGHHHSASYGGSGVWDTTTANWYNGTTDVAWGGGPHIAAFNGQGGQVTVTERNPQRQPDDDQRQQRQSYEIDGDTLYGIGAASFTINVSGTATIGATLTGSQTAIYKTGTGTLILTGSNTYTGSTTISAGTLEVDSSGALPSGMGVVDNATLQVNTTTPFTISNNIIGTGSLIKSGSGVLTLTGNNAYNGTVNGGTLSVNNNAELGNSLTLNGGTLQTTATGITLFRSITLGAGGGTLDTDGNAVTLSGAISGSGSLTKIGDGTLSLTGADTYSGGTDVEAGTLKLGASFAASYPLTVNGGTLDLNGQSLTVSSLHGTVDADGNGGTITNNASSPATLTLADWNVQTLTYAGILEDGTSGGTVALTLSGNATLVLSGSNTYSGPTTISAGTLQAGAEYALSPYSDMTVGSGAYLDLNGFDNEVNTLSGTNTSHVENSAAGTTATLIVGNNAAGSVFSGVLQDVGTGQLALDKIGGDTLTLTGTSTYTGQTTVEGGTLNISGSVVSPVLLDGGEIAGPGARTVMGSATTTTLTSSASPWVYGQSVTFTATVTVSGPGGGPASGAVVFMDGNTPLGMVALDAPGNAAFTTAAMGLGDHTISAFYRGSVTQVLLPSGSDSIEHQVNPATPTDLTINSFTMDDQGQIQISYTVGNASAPPFSIGVYGSPDSAHLGDLLQTYEVSDPQFLTVGPQTVTFPADFSDGDPGNYLIAVLDPGDDVYETSRAGNVGNLSLAGTATAFRNGDDGNVYVFAEGCWWNNVAVTQDPTSGDVYVAVSSDSYYNGYTFSNASNVYVYSPGGSTVSIDPGVTAPCRSTPVRAAPSPGRPPTCRTSPWRPTFRPRRSPAGRRASSPSTARTTTPPARSRSNSRSILPAPRIPITITPFPARRTKAAASTR